MTEASGSADLLNRLKLALAPAYDVEREIGRGGMAVVYRARDTRLNRNVAIKLLPPDLAYRSDIRARFLQEAQTAAHLNHPNIVSIFAVDEREGLVYFVMALVEGEGVGDRLHELGRLPVPEARSILRQVADALAYAHARGVVHRDIKPDNILLDAASGRAMVTDFGIARATREGESRLTATGAAIGTPAYMSPEQCAGDRALDGRADLYSLGAVAYQMLTGAPPFDGTSTPAVMMKHVMERPVPVRERRPDVPEDLDRIIMRLLEKDPADRFDSGSALVAALDGAPVAPPRSVRAAALPPPPPQPAPVVSAPAPMLPDPMAAPYAWMADPYTMRHTIRQMARAGREARLAAMPLPVQVRRFRESLVRNIGLSAFLVAINVATSHEFPWAVFPIAAFGMEIWRRGSSLWARGVRLKDVFGAQRMEVASGDPTAAAQIAAGVTTPGLAWSSVGSDAVPATTAPAGDPALDGPHGGIVRQARADRRTVDDVFTRLSEDEQARLPDARGTADALLERISALATALGQLDGEFPPGRLATLDQRIAGLEQAPGGIPDGDRRVSLLKKQREMLTEVDRSRATLLEQCESAGLLLQNLALDMLKIRSSGLDAALSGVTSVTQDARAVSREIGYAIEAADELRALGVRE